MRKTSIVACLSLLIAGMTAQAHSYYDVTTDGSEIYADTYDDAPAPNSSCPAYTDIQVNLNGYVGDGVANYPGTAHVAVSTPATAGVDYSWSRDITHYGQQRGGNCGAFVETLVAGPISFARTYTQATSPFSDASGLCAQQNACTNGLPRCPISSIKEGYEVAPCDQYHETLIPVVFGGCTLGVSIPASGSGACTIR
jgi:hypothetical protein